MIFGANKFGVREQYRADIQVAGAAGRMQSHHEASRRGTPRACWIATGHARAEHGAGFNPKNAEAEEGPEANPSATDTGGPIAVNCRQAGR